jgi:hypothetical protein
LRSTHHQHRTSSTRLTLRAPTSLKGGELARKRLTAAWRAWLGTAPPGRGIHLPVRLRPRHDSAPLGITVRVALTVAIDRHRCGTHQTLGHTCVRHHSAARQRSGDGQGSSDIGEVSHVWTFPDRVGTKLREKERAFPLIFQSGSATRESRTPAGAVGQRDLRCCCGLTRVRPRPYAGQRRADRLPESTTHAFLYRNFDLITEPAS